MGLEHSPRPEPDREVVAAYATTFIRRYDMYRLQLPDGRYVSLKKRLPLGRRRLTGCRYHLITTSGAPLAPTVRANASRLWVT